MKEKIKFDESVSYSLFYPLAARYYESKRENPYFIDEKAIYAIENIDYDFSDMLSTKLSKNGLNIYGCCSRTTLIDNQLQKCIDKFGKLTVLNLGCGLDARFDRFKTNDIKWFNIDFDNVINLREKLNFDDNKNIVNIRSSVFDFKYLDDIDSNENIVVIAEGLLMYFDEFEVKKLFTTLSKKFKNLVIIAELMGSWVVEHQKIHKVNQNLKLTFKYGVNKPDDFLNLCSNFKMTYSGSIMKEMQKYSKKVLLCRLLMPKANQFIATFEKII